MKQSGIYALYLQLDIERKQQIGRLGIFRFQPGIYVYIGSTQGAEGVLARVKLPLRTGNRKSRHWHIDWFRLITQPLGFHWSPAMKSEECQWALSPERLALREPIGFGASDCSCRGYLLRFLSIKEPQLAIKSAYDLLKVAFNGKPILETITLSGWNYLDNQSIIQFTRRECLET